jgi:tRNA pseudouridine55 synthase
MPDAPLGIAVVDKEAGFTSHDVVARGRRVFGTRKVGHSGTLDPGATGVLLLGVGRATRLLRFLTDLPKTYTTTVVLGTETDTLDDSGVVTATHDMTGVSSSRIAEAAAGFVGDILQVPPMVSAVRIEGKRLHQLAREGIEVDRPARPVTVHALEVSSIDEADGTFRIEVTCSSGTYVRTLAADIGAALGGGAHLRDLRRTAIGSFTEAEASPIDEAVLLSPAEGLRDYPAITVAGEVAKAVGHGKVLERVELAVVGGGPWRVLDDAGVLLAVYESHGDERLKPAVVLAG